MGRLDTSSVVLVVEDEPFQRKDIEEMLRAGGYSVVAARNAKQALTLLNTRNDIGVVVTDVRLPGALDGMVVAWHAARNHPVIVLSAYVRLGRDDLPALSCRWLSKPLDRAIFLGEVQQAAGRAQALSAFGRRTVRGRNSPRLDS